MRTLCLVLILALGVPGCSHFTASGKRNRAYNQQMKKVAKQRKQRQEAAKQKQARVIPAAPPISEPQISTSVEQ